MSTLGLSREHSDLSTEAEGNTTPTWSSERKVYVICFKSLVKNEFFLSSLLWGEKIYRRVFGIHCFALALSSSQEHWHRAPIPEWLTRSSFLKNKALACRSWGGSPCSVLLILSNPQNWSTFQFSHWQRELNLCLPNRSVTRKSHVSSCWGTCVCTRSPFRGGEELLHCAK